MNKTFQVVDECSWGICLDSFLTDACAKVNIVVDDWFLISVLVVEIRLLLVK
jgi:hypothetical protein